MDSDVTGFVLAHSCVKVITSVVLKSCVFSDGKNAEVGNRERLKVVRLQHCEVSKFPMRDLGAEPDTFGL